MPKAAVHVALMIAVSLSVIAYLTLHKPPLPALTSRLLSDVDPARVDTVAIQPADGRAIMLSVGEEGVEWVLTASTTTDKSFTAPWPAAASRVRAAIRLLCDLKVESPRDDLISPGSKATSVSLTSSELGSMGTALVQIAESSVAGRTNIVRTGIGAASAESNFAQAFAMTDLSLWREPLVFSLAPQEWSRLEVSGQGSAIVMSRVGRAWALQKPISASADSTAVEKTIKALSGASMVRFVDKPDPEVVKSFEKPAAILTTEFERREQVGERVTRRVVVQELRVGSPADVGGTTVLCQATAWSRDLSTNATTNLWGPAVVVVDSAALAGLASDAASYVSRVSLRSPVADIFQVAIGEWVYGRVASGWRPVGAVTITPDDAKNLQLFLSLVGDERASKVLLKPAEALPTPTRVSFKSSDGVVVQDLSLGIARATGGEAITSIVTFDGTSYRVYESKQIAGLAEWLFRSKK